MDTFFKAAAGVIVGLVLHIILSKQGKEFSVLITIISCCVLATVLMTIIEPILLFVERVRVIGQLNADALKIIVKTIGIGLVGELVSLLCIDAGNTALGKMLQILTTVIITWLSLPLLSEFLKLIEDILKNI